MKIVQAQLHMGSTAYTPTFSHSQPLTSGVLWSVSGQLVVFMFIYAGVGTLVTTSVFGKVLMRLFYNVRLLFLVV